MTKTYDNQLLEDWEEIFRQGLLNFWILTALKDAQLSVADVCAEIGKLTNDFYTPAEQSLYRVLRKNYSLKLVDFVNVPGNGGPMKKLYSLSESGEKMLSDFTKRNINELFQIPKIKNNVEQKKP